MIFTLFLSHSRLNDLLVTIALYHALPNVIGNETTNQDTIHVYHKCAEEWFSVYHSFETRSLSDKIRSGEHAAIHPLKITKVPCLLFTSTDGEFSRTFHQASDRDRRCYCTDNTAMNNKLVLIHWSLGDWRGEIELPDVTKPLVRPPQSVY
jgi:hypothetical protein